MRLKRIFALLVAVLLLTPMTAYGISAVLTEPQSYAFGSVKPQFVAANHVLMLRADGRLFGWGDNSRGQLGLGAGADRQYAEAVELVYFKDKAIKQILAIKDASYVLLQNGEVYSCGSGANGRLGQGRLDDLNTWTQIPNSVSLGIFSLYGNCNSASVFAITADDSLLACGKNDVGQLGINSTADALSFTKVMDYADIKSLHIGENFAAMIKMDGTAKATGSLLNGQTGVIPLKYSQGYPERVCGYGINHLCSYHVNAVTAQYPISSNALLFSDTTSEPNESAPETVAAWCTNYNDSHAPHQTASHKGGKPYYTATHVFATSLAGGTDIAYGNAHGIMKRADGSYIGWGDVKKKQLLGQTDVTDGVVLTALNDKIAELTSQGYNDFKVKVAGDSNYLIARNAAAKLYKTFGWGSNTRGKLGVNSEQASFNVLTELPTLNGINVEQIVAGIGNVFFITDKGDVWATGNNAFGQLGLGAGFGGMTVNTPTLVPNVKWSEKALPPIINSVTVSTEWGSANTIAIAATGYGGSMEYAVSESKTTPPTAGWQSSASFAMSANGKYYAWARDNVGLVSTPVEFTVTKVDAIAPVISGVTVPQEWGKTSTITIAATDGESGLKEYAISGSKTTAPPVGWQSSASFTLDKNGTYYAWVRDKANNVSLPFTLAVTKVDAIAPVISGVTVPQEWGKTSTITIAATDGESGLKEYAISGSNTTAPPVGWQSSASFTLDKNGTYYAWARDKANNVSLPFTLAVTKVDAISPVISGVTVPQEWGKTNTIAIAATDGESGLKEYAISGSNTTAPTVGRQSSAEFSLSTNGKYYAWVWDNAGNVSLPIEFVVNKVDAIAPVISDITMQQEWGKTSTIAIAAADIESGIKEYAISDNNITAPTVGWQSPAEFSLSTNGTYYAWVRDTSENISAPFSFVVDKIDKLQPVIESIIIKEKRLLQQGRINTYAPGISIDEEVPDKWVKAVEIIIKAKDSSATSDDGCSGVADYAITVSENTPITLWQVSNSFTLTENGIIFLWVRDVAGNISQVQSYNLNKIDDVPPIFGDGEGDGTSGNNSVTLPSTWGTAADVTIKGGDNTGVQDFAVTATTEMPVTWQDTPTFNINANGIYFAWMKDRSNNIIGPDRFEVNTVDKLPPLVNSVSVENGAVIFDAADAPKDDHNGCSGISGYSVTKSGTLPTPIFHRDRHGSEMKLDYDWLPLESIKISESGAYEARTIDFAGNVSLPLSFDYTLPPMQEDDTDKPNEDNAWENIGNDILTDNSQAEDKVYSITMDGGVRIPTSLLRRLRGKDVILRIEQGERYVWALDCRTIGDIPMWQIYYNLTISENEEGNRYFYQLPCFTPQTVHFDVTQKDKSNFPFLAELSVRIHYSFGDKYIYYRLKDGELIGGELPMEKLPQYLRKKIE